MNAKILIVDDNTDNLKTLVGIFEKYRPDFEIFQTNNSKLAAKIASTVLPDIIISDWDMPKISGIELLKILKSNTITKDIPIIIASGIMLDSGDLQTALEGGAVDYIKKPIDSIELLARTNSALTIANYHKSLIAEKDQKLSESKISIISSHKLLQTIRKQLIEVQDIIIATDAKEKIESSIELLSKKIHKENWDRYQNAFNSIFGNFEKSLGSNYPGLTPAEIKICSLIKTGMGSNEIANILNQSPDSIRVSRSRIRKKMDIDRNKSLKVILDTI